MAILNERETNQDEVAIIIPAWNEEKTIEGVISSVIPHGRVIVVNDASTDQTALFAEHAGATLVNHCLNKGYDGALNSGFKKAVKLGVKYILTFDADGQHNPADIPYIIERLKAGADLVVGIRPNCARISEKLFSLLTWQIYGLRDPLCGLKGYQNSLYHDAGNFDSCNSIGTELALFACKRKKYKVEQFPVGIYSRQDQPRFGTSLKANLRIFYAMCRVFLKN